MDVDDNLTEYADPDLYDLENRDFEPDGLFFLEYARKLGGRVLELGCGTGRVTIPLAQHHVNITGLDVVPGMIQRAREKAGDLQIQWVVDDIRYFQLKRTFRLLFETGSVFQHLLTTADQEAYLARVWEHMEDDSRFIFSLRFPHPDLLTSEEDEKEWFQYEDPDGHLVRVSGIEVYDPIRQVKVETAYRRWVDDRGQDVLKIAPLSLRYTFPQEIEALLHYNGFEVVERFGDWDLCPLADKSSIMIFVCRKQN